jgi:hypothetical protein
MIFQCAQHDTGSFAMYSALSQKRVDVPNIRPLGLGLGKFLEHLWYTFQMLLVTTMKAHVEDTFQIYPNCDWWLQ